LRDYRLQYAAGHYLINRLFVSADRHEQRSPLRYCTSMLRGPLFDQYS
jgi:hypothetical protein